MSQTSRDTGELPYPIWVLGDSNAVGPQMCDAERLHAPGIRSRATWRAGQRKDHHSTGDKEEDASDTASSADDRKAQGRSTQGLAQVGVGAGAKMLHNST